MLLRALFLSVILSKGLVKGFVKGFDSKFDGAADDFGWVSHCQGGSFFAALCITAVGIDRIQNCSRCAMVSTPP